MESIEFGLSVVSLTPRVVFMTFDVNDLGCIFVAC